MTAPSPAATTPPDDAHDGAGGSPGSTVTPVGTTSLAEADSRAVDIRSLSGLVLLEALLEP